MRDCTGPFRDDLLAGRRALCTGGGTGIGRAIALELLPDHPGGGEGRARNFGAHWNVFQTAKELR